MGYNFKKIRRSVSIDDLKSRIRIEEVVRELGIISQYGLHRSGTSLKGNCPSGHASQSGTCFSIDLPDNLYHCYHCHTSGDIVSLVKLCKGSDTSEAVQWLAAKFAHDLVGAAGSSAEKDFDHDVTYIERRDLFNLIYEHGKDQLLNDAKAQVVRDYLVNDRKYDLSRLGDTEFIYWDFETATKAYLHGKAPEQAEEIAALKLTSGQGDLFRLAIPYRDMHGVITGFLKRAHIPSGFAGSMRWDSTPGLTKPSLFGLHRIEKNEDTLLVVEGYPDATYLPALGIKNIAAFGQAALSEKYIEGLYTKGIKQIILALDNDGAGLENTEKCCLRFAQEDIKVFVIDPGLLQASKDPDEFVVANGVNALMSLMQNAEPGASWMTKRMLSKSPLTTALEKEKAIQEVFEYADSLGNIREAEMAVETLAAELSLTNEVLIEEFHKLKEANARKAFTEGMQALSRDAEKGLASGDTDTAIRTLQEGIAELQAEFWRTKEPAKVGLSGVLAEKKAADEKKMAGTRIGYELKDFSEIDREILGLQSGLYVIGADPNIGKTALMVSLAIDVLRSNTDAAVLFYSMDDSQDTIINRFLAHMSDMKINEVRYKLTDSAKQATLDQAYEQIGTWADASRLEIREATESLTMRRIHNEIREHPRREKLVVFIDGLYNVPVETESGSIREENIERANQVKQLVKSFKLPVLATAEFRKQGRDESSSQTKTRTIHDIMETGKYGYNADLVILLSPKDTASYGSQDEPIITAHFAKNKLEAFRGTMEFRFIRAKSVMTFIGGSTAQP